MEDLSVGRWSIVGGSVVHLSVGRRRLSVVSGSVEDLSVVGGRWRTWRLVGGRLSVVGNLSVVGGFVIRLAL